MASMSSSGETVPTGAERALEADWRGLCRQAVAQQKELFEREAGIEARTVYEGVGEGGDRALAIDRRSEDIVFAQLEALEAEGARFTAISEERGEVRFGSGSSPVRVVLDPIDGSLNARRTLPSHALSLAVADGDSMADVVFAYVYDFGAGEEFVATRGGGAFCNDRPIEAVGPGYGLELVGIEAAAPKLILPLVEGLAGRAYRLRGIGSIAITLAYVAGGRLDGMLTARPCRSVDAAASQLIAREAGARVAFDGADGATADLGLRARYHLAAALDDETLSTLLEVQANAVPAEIS
jgi:myo-inositol-1(or 4)-monophosphatase